MSDEEYAPEIRAEILRKKHRYRELLLSGRITLSHERAAQLLGPDCLYQLYALEKRHPHPASKRKTRRQK
jgi:hypothetical protein